MIYQPNLFSNVIEKSTLPRTTDLNSEPSSPPGMWVKEKHSVMSLDCNLKGFYTHGDLQACNQLLEENVAPSKIACQKK